MTAATKRRLRSRWSFVLDSDYGERKIPSQCALVFDLKDRYPELKRPHVNENGIAFTDPDTDERLKWPCPPNVRAWIKAFDDGESPEPLPVILQRANARTKGNDRKRETVSPAARSRTRPHTSKKVHRR